MYEGELRDCDGLGCEGRMCEVFGRGGSISGEGEEEEEGCSGEEVCDEGGFGHGSFFGSF